MRRPRKAGPTPSGHTTSARGFRQGPVRLLRGLLTLRIAFLQESLSSKNRFPYPRIVLQAAYLQAAYLQAAYLQAAYLQAAYLQAAYLQAAYLQPTACKLRAP
jgi:hypothetical protein